MRTENNAQISTAQRNEAPPTAQENTRDLHKKLKTELRAGGSGGDGGINKAAINGFLALVKGGGSDKTIRDADVATWFKKADANKDGKVTKTEVLTLLKNAGLNDEAKYGKIDWNNTLANIFPEGANEMTLRQTFEKIGNWKTELLINHMPGIKYDISVDTEGWKGR